MPAHIISTELTDDLAETIGAAIKKLEAKGERVVQVQPLGHRFLIVTEAKSRQQRAPEKRVTAAKETR